MILCPHCRAPLGEQNSSGELRATCAKCHYAYWIRTGKLTDRSSHQVMIQQETGSRSGTYRREYEFRLTLPWERLEVVSFSIPGAEDRILARRGDTVSVIYSTRDALPEELVSILDHTTGSAYDLNEPGSTALQRAMSRGAILGVVGLLLALSAGVGFVVALLLSLGAFVGSTVYFSGRLSPKRQLSEAAVQELGQAQDLLEKKRSLVEARTEVERELSGSAALRDRLLSLQRKMEGVGRETYESRIDAIARAIPLLERQISVNGALIGAYQKSIGMIDIEIESGAAARELPSDIAGMLEARAGELRALEVESEELGRQLAAIEEVERALQSPSSA